MTANIIWNAANANGGTLRCSPGTGASGCARPARCRVPISPPPASGPKAREYAATAQTMLTIAIVARFCTIIASTFLLRTMPPWNSASPGVMNNTRAALPSTHAVSPASTCMRGRMARSCYRTVAGHVSGVLRPGLDRVRPPFPCPHPDQLLDPRRPDLAVADLPGRRGLGDDLHHVMGVVVGDDHVEAHLGDEVDGVLRTPIHLRVTLLPPVAADLTDGQTLHPEALQR